eukprot:CAMPEP_0119103468 /NCGR_PEP_ID=MMETSP1180-20130426/1900_1 /TAXON_ID=3052 ORGANISM="Chlamydomonas cf sp, Strain CCMP681" /NCGR_SAMPLE_ID=MMETSP1180 /ASSEMBLY_ACC=CAM_ASM_000741 /LENGTH=194 /DNA_ID=CAMNT_0007087979 /DNA_START=97 /DNA_END=681 /DNA_ORIENTATION=-
MERVAQAIAGQQFDLIAALLDRAELESASPAVLAANWPHAVHLLGHIYNKQLEDARFVWKRIPAGVKQDNPELEAVWRLLQYMWQRQYQGMWQAMQAYTWSPQLQPLMHALADKVRAELLDLLSTAYSTVRPAKVASICGLTEQEAYAACSAAGWLWDETKGTFSPLVRTTPVQEDGQHATLKQLGEYTWHLEQ